MSQWNLSRPRCVTQNALHRVWIYVGFSHCFASCLQWILQYLRFAIWNCMEDLSGLSWQIWCSLFVVFIVFGFCFSLSSIHIIFVVLDYLLGHLGFHLLELREVIIVEYNLNHQGFFKHCLNCWQFFILCVSLHTFIVVHHYFGMELSFIGLARIKQSNQQGLKHCQAFDKGFTLHPRLCRQQGSLKKLTKRRVFQNLKCHYDQKTNFFSLDFKTMLSKHYLTQVLSSDFKKTPV